MILLDIKHFFVAKQMANLRELSIHFKQQPDTMRMMLEHWVRKGKLTIMPKPAKCGSKCMQCPETIAEIYRWEG